MDNKSKLCYYFFAKIIVFVANGSFWAKFGYKNCFSIQISNCNLALRNRKLYFDKVTSRKKKKGRAIVIPNGHPPCFNCYLRDLRASLGHFITSQLRVQYCNLSVAQFLMQGSPGTLFRMAQDWDMLHGKLSNVYCSTFYNKPLCHSLLFQIQWPTGFELTTRDS